MRKGLKQSRETKARLIEAAGEVFGQRGFRWATVREICRRAGANVGAVNYHFGDKEGLYNSVLEESHSCAVRKYPPTLGLREGATAEEKLRAFIRSLLLRLLDKEVPSWHGKLLGHECSDPTRSLDKMIRTSVRPLIVYLESIVFELMEEGKERVNRDMLFLCAMSVLGQCMLYFVTRGMVDALRPQSFDPGEVERIADHVTRFSLGAIRSYGSLARTG